MAQMPKIDLDAPPPPLRDAATIMLVRNGDDGLEVLMVRRTPKAAFAAGAMVFPGGAVDPADAETTDLVVGLADGRDTTELPRMLFAAARELFEEAAVVLIPDHAADAVPAGDDRLALRRDVLAGEAGFAAWLRSVGLAIDAGRIAYVARWVTPIGETRRFDTRFFLAAAPGGQHPRHDERETTEVRWIRPADALAASKAGEIGLLPPTIANLTWLARHASAEDALAAGLERDVPTIAPEVIRDADGSVVISFGPYAAADGVPETLRLSGPDA